MIIACVRNILKDPENRGVEKLNRTLDFWKKRGKAADILPCIRIENGVFVRECDNEACKSTEEL